MTTHQKKKAILSLSGGMDSSTMLGEMKVRSDYLDVLGAYMFTYGSKHNRHEIKAASEVAGWYNVPFRVIDLTVAFAGFRSDLMASGGALPHGHYEAESMRKTVVPGRNTIFASVLAGLAESVGADEVWLGIHAGDHHIYPDCRPEWLTAMNHTVMLSSESKVRLTTPFLHKTKKDIVYIGSRIRVPYDLTRTCYSEDEVACGKCGSCVERREAFMLNGLVDPIQYQYTGPLPQKP